jgi:heme oxygenase
VEPRFDIFQLLKERTQDTHELLEDAVPVLHSGFGLNSYIQLLERFYGFWAPMESSLSQVKILEHPDLDIAGRMKSSMLESDLQFFGRQPSDVPRCKNLPSTTNFPRCIGCLYVLEGSTLGSRIISKALLSNLGLTATSGASFFNAYGDSVGRRWNEFRTFVTAHAAPVDAEEIVAAARETFVSLLEWLERPQ